MQVCISSNQYDVVTQTNHLRGKLSVHFVYKISRLHLVSRVNC